LKSFLMMTLCLWTSVTGLLAQTATPNATPGSGEDAQSLFAKAKDYFNQKNYDQAREDFSRFVAEHPMDQMIPQAKLLLARMEQDFNASTKEFAQLAQEYADKPEGAEAQKDLGARFYLADKYGDAALTYGEFLKTHPQSASAPEARYWYACSLYSLDKCQEAVTEFAEVAEDSPESPWAPKALLAEGNTYVKLNLYSLAEKQYLRVMERYPLFSEMNLVYYRLGRVYELEGKTVQAHAAYTNLLAQYPRALEAEDAGQRMTALEKINPSLTPIVQIPAPTPTENLAAVPGNTPVPAETPDSDISTTETASEATAQTNAANPFHVQIGVYSNKKFMAATLKKFQRAGYHLKVLKMKTEDMAYPLYKVRMGNFPDHASALKASQAFTKKTRIKTFVVED